MNPYNALLAIIDTNISDYKQIVRDTPVSDMTPIQLEYSFRIDELSKLRVTVAVMVRDWASILTDKEAGMWTGKCPDCGCNWDTDHNRCSVNPNHCR